MLEHGIVSIERQISTQTITIRQPLFHLSLQHGLTYHPKKLESRQKPHETVPQKIFPKRTDYVTERIRISIRNMMRKWAWNSINFFLPTPQFKIRFMSQSEA